MSDFYKCLLCDKYFTSFLKAEAHIENHDQIKSDGLATNGRRRGRGMLPIQKVNFPQCHIILQHCQDIPQTPQVYERSTRKSRLKANLKLKQVSKLLSTIEDDKPIWKRSNRKYTDSDFVPVDKPPGGKRGRPPKPKVDVPGPQNRSKPIRKSMRGGYTKDQKDVKCPHCPFSFFNKVDLSQHLFDCHKDIAEVNLILCPISTCAQPNHDYVTLFNHIRKHCWAQKTQEISLKSDEKVSTATLKNKVFLRHIRSNNFKCKFCLQSLNSIDSLQNHLLIHDQVNLKCKFCDELFEENVSLLIDHMKTSHLDDLHPLEERQKALKEKKMFKCDKCIYKSSNICNVKAHRKTHDKKVDTLKFTEEAYLKRPFPCSACPHRFNQKHHLQRHFLTHLESHQFKCDVSNCNEKFRSDYELKCHQEVHLNGRFECHLCPKSFMEREHLSRHLHSKTAHDPDKPKVYKSRQALKLYRNRLDNMEVHMKSEKGIFPNEEIELVDKIILDENGEAIHLKGEELTPRILQPEAPEKVLCTPKTIISLPDTVADDPVFKKLSGESLSAIRFRTVRRNHYKRERFDCKICRAQFSRSWSLQFHMKIRHNDTILGELTSRVKTEDGGGISLICGTCAYPANNKDDLESHLKTHKRMWKCNRKGCGIPFTSNKKLEGHVERVHDSEKKHSCTFCEKKYGSRDCLTKHIRKVHDNPEGSSKAKKKCPICEKVFSISYYSTHIKSHENDGASRSKCLLCDDTFVSKAILKRHIEGVHMGKRKQSSFANEKESQEKKAEDGTILGI